MSHIGHAPANKASSQESPPSLTTTLLSPSATGRINTPVGKKLSNVSTPDKPNKALLKAWSCRYDATRSSLRCTASRVMLSDRCSSCKAENHVVPTSTPTAMTGCSFPEALLVPKFLPLPRMWPDCNPVRYKQSGFPISPARTSPCPEECVGRRGMHKGRSPNRKQLRTNALV